MADLGCQPTKKTVRITSTTGEFGTIPAATEASAGVATADQCKRWNEAWQWLFAARTDGTLLAPPEIDTSQFVTRAEVQQVLKRPPPLRPIALPAPATDAAPRVQALEERTALLEEALATILSDDTVQRLQAQVMDMERMLQQLYHLVSKDASDAA